MTSLPVRFADRRDAGRHLAEALREYAGRDDVIVLGLPRGGVPVAAEVAAALNVPFDAFIVRKLGAPWHRELALGAIAEGGVEIRHEEAMRSVGVSADEMDEVAAVEREELTRRIRAYRGDHPAPRALAGRTVLLVDDGLATGATMEAAVAAVRHAGATRVIVAVPVGPRDTRRRIERVADQCVCLLQPDDFSAVGEWYDDFSQTSDEDVLALLHRPAE